MIKHCHLIPVTTQLITSRDTVFNHHYHRLGGVCFGVLGAGHEVRIRPHPFHAFGWNKVVLYLEYDLPKYRHGPVFWCTSSPALLQVRLRCFHQSPQLSLLSSSPNAPLFFSARSSLAQQILTPAPPPLHISAAADLEERRRLLFLNHRRRSWKQENRTRRLASLRLLRRWWWGLMMAAAEKMKTMMMGFDLKFCLIWLRRRRLISLRFEIFDFDFHCLTFDFEICLIFGRDGFRWFWVEIFH
ncbi:hypothetical protein Droror1_Dr00015454 [Drosera rotundifolia]